MDGEKLERIREICHIQRFEMNALWDEKADEVIERYSQGLPVKKTITQTSEIPTIRATLDEMKRYINTQATPEEAAIIESQLRAMAGWIKDSKNSINLNYQMRQESKIKISTV
jgi:hypothetical protein